MIDRYIPYPLLSSPPASAPPLRVVDEPRPPGRLLDAADLHALPLLDDPHELGRADQRAERAGVEPGGAPVEHGDPQLALARYASLTAGSPVRRGHSARVHGRSRRPGCRRSTGPARRGATSASPASPRWRYAALVVELDHAVLVRVGHRVGEDPAAGDVGASSRSCAEVRPGGRCCRRGSARPSRRR